MDLNEKIKSKQHSPHRTLVLEPIPGKHPTNTLGLVDKRLFTGGNNLYALQGPTNDLWTLRYESGVLPLPLKQSFTSFRKLYQFAEEYFGKRGLHIVEVIDNHAEV